MNNQRLTHLFTLMEVMIAALIFTLSAVITLQIVGTSRGHYLRDQKRWIVQHVVTNAAEFYLMCGPAAIMPDGMLPDGYTATCELNDIEDDLPEDARESIKEFRLGEYTIRVFQPGGELLEELHVRKLVKEEDVDYVNSIGK